MRARLTDALQALAVVGTTGLLAGAISREEGASVANQWRIGLGAALVPTAVLLVIRVLRPHGHPFGNQVVARYPPYHILVMRIGFGSFCVAMLGFLTFLLVSPAVGYWLVVLGVATGWLVLATGLVIRVVRGRDER